MVKIGLVAFANNSGLGAQTRRLAKLINPHRILVIDSSNFSKNKKQHFEWYEDYEFFVSRGFPSDTDSKLFLQGLTHVFTCENPYNFNMVYWAKQKGIKFYCQVNYEFSENVSKRYLPVPDLFLMPSHWKLNEMERIFGTQRVKYLPPPIETSEFEKPLKKNLKRSGKPRILHMIGTLASYDRNGTMQVLDAVTKSKSDFELVVHSQHPLPMTYFLDDSRVKYRIANFEYNHELYDDFDFVLLPRKFGGLCLPMNEALMSGLPVIMTDISPNNSILPKDWLVNATYSGTFNGVAPVDMFSADSVQLAQKIDKLVSTDLKPLKTKALSLGIKHFSFEALKNEYLSLFESG